MTASEGSYIGLAQQTAKGTAMATDASFTYLLLLRSALGINNANLPLDMEVGGGAFQRNVVKAGVTTGGAIRFIPRPESIGHFLKAYFGKCTSTPGSGDDVSHLFEFMTSQFDAPYYTIRNSPGGMFGHQYQDQRLAALSFDFAARDFLRASAAFVGGIPKKVATTAWSPGDYTDEGPQFLSVLSKIEVPDGTSLKVLSGTIGMQNAIPLDQQWIIGSYSPDDFAINQRAVAMNLVIKVADDGVLYNKLALDPDAGTAWTANLFKEADLDISFVSNEEAGTGVDYSITFSANGESGDTSNVIWQVAPLDIIPGRQIVMNVVGTFLADPTAGADPFSVTLVNQETAYADPS